MALNSAQLKQLLNLDLSDLDKLKASLAKEREALSTNDTTLLQQATQVKQQLLACVRQRAKEKSRIIIQSGAKVRPGQVGAYLQTLNDKELIILWQAVTTKLQQCKEQNQINEKVVSLSLQRINKTMNIIRGQHNRPNLYGAKGSTQTMGSGHVIGTA